MKSLTQVIAVFVVGLMALPSFANAPEPTYEQTREWVVSTIVESAGYSRQGATITYKDVSIEGCHLQFTTVTSTSMGYVDSDTFNVSLDSVKNILWGTAANPSRGYVIFTAATPINLSRQRVWSVVDRQTQNTNASTTIGALEFGKPGAAHGDIATHMKDAILRAADLCKVRLAAK